MMPKLLSHDLRVRVVRAIDAGMSRRQAAARFEVSPSTAIRWHDEWRRTGACRAKPQGGDRWSHVTEAHASRIHAIIEEAGDITLVELKARLAGTGGTVSRLAGTNGTVSRLAGTNGTVSRLAGTGGTVSISALSRFFRRHGVTRKKRPATPPSKAGRTFSRAGRPGSSARSSSTRPG